MPVFIFDMDGTVTDTNHLWRSYGVFYLQSLGITPPEGDVLRSCEIGVPAHCRELIETYHLDITPDALWQWHMSKMPEYYETGEVKRDVIAFLEKAKAKGIKMAIATATPHEMCDPILKRVGLWDYFDLVYTNSQWNTTKEKPDLYLRCCKDLGGQPEQAVIFEDALYAIKTATKAGLYTVAIQDATEPHPDEVKRLADQYIVNYADLDWSKLPK